MRTYSCVRGELWFGNGASIVTQDHWTQTNPTRVRRYHAYTATGTFAGCHETLDEAYVALIWHPIPVTAERIAHVRAKLYARLTACLATATVAAIDRLLARAIAEAVAPRTAA